VNVASFGVAEGGLSWSRLAIATGEGFPDALAGGVLQGEAGSVVLLTQSNTLSDAAEDALGMNSDEIVEVRFLGGPGAVSLFVRDCVALALQ
jgi:hypothetical protein